ncbi:MAG: (2Fe-2S)-binding protein [Azospirillaceae bacterium]
MPSVPSKTIHLSVNGRPVEAEVECRMPLAELLRDRLRLTGTHIGCDTSQCGACTVHVDGVAVRSCTLFAVQADGSEVRTIEGVGTAGEPHPLQAAFQEHHALQCGFCTPGMIMTALELLRTVPSPTPETVRHYLEGNLCRCTGYYNIVKAVLAAAAETQGTGRPADEGSGHASL